MEATAGGGVVVRGQIFILERALLEMACRGEPGAR